MSRGNEVVPLLEIEPSQGNIYNCEYLQLDSNENHPLVRILPQLPPRFEYCTNENNEVTISPITTTTTGTTPPIELQFLLPDDTILVEELGSNNNFSPVLVMGNNEASSVPALPSHEGADDMVMMPPITSSTDVVVNNNHVDPNEMENGSAKEDEIRCDSSTNTETVPKIDDAVPEEDDGDRSVLYTKKGELRKRRKRGSSKRTDETQMLKKLNSQHPVLPPCSKDCFRKCTEKFSEERRQQINDEYWTHSWEGRHLYVKQASDCRTVLRKTGDRKNQSFALRLRDANNSLVQVCRTFFLTTLGYTKTNNSVLKKALDPTWKGNENSTIYKDLRGKHTNRWNAIDRSTLKSHIMSFNPCVSHYRREHAPNRLYLPSDVTIQFMYDDFREKYPNVNCSYYTYRSVVVDDMKISFTKLGHEECESCEVLKQHNPDHKKDLLDPNCEECKSWNKHILRAESARKCYRKDAESKEWLPKKRMCISVDLQKVVMIPRIDTFKQVNYQHID